MYPASSKTSSLTTAGPPGNLPSRAPPGCCACVQFFLAFLLGEYIERVKAALPEVEVGFIMDGRRQAQASMLHHQGCCWFSPPAVGAMVGRHTAE